MKTIKLLFATALLSGVATLAYAGPSPDAWARAQKIQKPQDKAQPAVCTTTCSCAAMKKS